ncbi:MAG: hypothetical protein FWC64_01920 [Treponema sp.]|nr:hypothetical protein [Treponema sp.]
MKTTIRHLQLLAVTVLVSAGLALALTACRNPMPGEDITVTFDLNGGTAVTPPPADRDCRR